MSFQMWTDAWMIQGAVDNLKQRLKDKRRSNTYVYLFSHKGSASFTEFVGGDPETFYGTSHLDELLYLFPMQKSIPVFYNSIPTRQDLKVKDIMVKFWVNFATTG